MRAKIPHYLSWICGITFIITSCVNKDDRTTIAVSPDSTINSFTNSNNDSIDVPIPELKGLRTNKKYNRFFAGSLDLPTGQVVCTDPMYRELGFPQTWTVKPGTYPVFLYVALDGEFDGRIAYAELMITNDTPSEWRYSMIGDKFLVDSFEMKINGMYPVENGLSSFSDYETFRIYNQEIDSFYAANKNGNYFTQILEPIFKQNTDVPKGSRGEDWANYKPKRSKGNIIMFASGWGDGLYPRYVGYDKNKNVLCMITDFIRIGED